MANEKMTVGDMIAEFQQYDLDTEVVIGHFQFDYIGTTTAEMPEVKEGKVRKEKFGGSDKVTDQDDWDRYDEDEDYETRNVVVIQ